MSTRKFPLPHDATIIKRDALHASIAELKPPDERVKLAQARADQLAKQEATAAKGLEDKQQALEQAREKLNMAQEEVDKQTAYLANIRINAKAAVEHLATQDQGFPGGDACPKHLSILSSAGKLDRGQQNLAFNPSKDSDDYSAETEGAPGEVFADGEGTTVMLCNIPCRVGRSNLVNALEACGLAGKYGHIRLPNTNIRRNKRLGSIGYCFISFSCLDDAHHFAKSFEDFQFPEFATTKKCTVKLARLQGLSGVWSQNLDQGFPGGDACPKHLSILSSAGKLDRGQEKGAGEGLVG